MIYHPDKISDVSARPAAEAIYVHLKLCRDVLIDPAKRFAYDRFGPDILLWRHCTTIPDYVKAGVQNTIMYYGGTGAVLVVLGMVGLLKQAPYVSTTKYAIILEATDRLLSGDTSPWLLCSSSNCMS